MKETRLRIFHAGDIHLDTPFSTMGAKESEIRRKELRGTFSSMMLYVRKEKCDIVLLSGDIFDDGYATEETASLMIREFSSCPNCRFVIAPGNHDPFRRGSVYEAKQFPKNVYIFREDHLSSFLFSDIGVEVYGWAFTSQFMQKNPLSGFVCPDNGRINLLCAHCDITSPISTSCPIPEGDIVKAGFDYAALGHIHKTDGIKTDGKVSYGYSGSLEGRSFDETGVHGGFICEFGYTGEKRIAFVPFSSRRYEVEKLDVTGALTDEEIITKTRELISDKKYDERTVLRLILSGSVSSDCSPSAAASALSKLFYCEIVNNTTPTFNSEELMRDITLKGALFRTLLPLLEGDDEEKRRDAAEALRCGLSVLSGSVPYED